MSTSTAGWLHALEQDRSLAQPEQLRRRIAVLDRLEDALLDEVEPTAAAAGLHERARAIRARLEAVNGTLYQSIRNSIQRGEGAHELRRWAMPSGPDDAPQGDDYDHLDELVCGVLSFETPGEPMAELAAEMVFYQPTPARHIFGLLERLALTERDVLVDLGAGLGHLPLLAAICTPACSVGVELEPVYVRCARRCAQALRLDRVRFEQQDARAADLAEGTVFYLYTPFTGTILRAVLDALRRQADSRAIRVCTYGPCTPVVARQPWLTTDDALVTDRVVVFRPR
jgi:hypothetical protein